MKRTVNLITFSLLLIIFVGCAGTASKIQVPYNPIPDTKLTYTVIPKAEISDEGLNILNARLDTQLTQCGLLAADTDQSGNSVDITITNYYMRHGAARALVGIMAGVDNMQSKVVVKNRDSQDIVGEFTVESTNPSAWGTSTGMIQEHADKIVQCLRSGSK